MNRNSELELTMKSLLEKDFKKVAQMVGMDPAMMGGAPPMDPAMMGGAPPMDPAMMGPPPEMMPPDMMPPVEPVSEESKADEAAKGMKEVAIKALDMAQDTINAIMGAEDLSPGQMADLTASAVSGSGALQNIPPEEIAAQA